MQIVKKMRMRMQIPYITLTFAFVLAACGGGAHGDPIGTVCDEYATQFICTDYTGSNYRGQHLLEHCPEGDIVDTCPAGSKEGQCVFKQGTSDEAIIYYYVRSDSSAQLSEILCEDAGGSWTDAPST